jgi:hypothetical protein
LLKKEEALTKLKKAVAELKASNSSFKEKYDMLDGNHQGLSEKSIAQAEEIEGLRDRVASLSSSSGSKMVLKLQDDNKVLNQQV